jgi:hypothetical protein
MQWGSTKFVEKIISILGSFFKFNWQNYKIRESKDTENTIICKLITNIEKNTCDDVYCNDISFPGSNCWDDRMMKTARLTGTEKTWWRKRWSSTALPFCMSLQTSLYDTMTAYALRLNFRNLSKTRSTSSKRSIKSSAIYRLFIRALVVSWGFSNTASESSSPSVSLSAVNCSGSSLN